MSNQYCIYILTNKMDGTLYIGSTNDLMKRVKEHKDKIVKGFTAKYNTDMLVYYEDGGDMYTARTREKQMKAWKREWKIKLIEKMNPEWKDLYCEMLGE